MRSEQLLRSKIMRSEAKKRADQKYAKKIAGKYKVFIVKFKPEEYDKIDKIISDAKMTKADFVRISAKKLESEIK